MTHDYRIDYTKRLKSKLILIQLADSKIRINGNVAIGAVGDLIPGFQIDGVFATGEAGSVALGDREIAITGVVSTGAVGTVVYSRSEAITGNEATGSVGTVEFSYVADGQVAYGQVGILGVIHTVALIEGWGAYGWGVEPWGGSPGASQIDTAVGNVVGGQLLGPGVSATGGVGSVTPGVIPFPEGDVAYGFVGTVGNIHEVALYTGDDIGWGNVTWGGDTSSSGYYDVAWGGAQNHNPAVAYTAVGTMVPVPEIPLVGVEATGQVGTVSPSHTLDPLTGVEATGQVGTVTANITVGLTGVQATGEVGTMGVIHINDLTGVQAVGIVGNVCVGNWTIIDTTQNASWAVIQSAQASSWQAIQNSQDAEWDLVVTEKC